MFNIVKLLSERFSGDDGKRKTPYSSDTENMCCCEQDRLAMGVGYKLHWVITGYKTHYVQGARQIGYRYKTHKVPSTRKIGCMI